MKLDDENLIQHEKITRLMHSHKYLLQFPRAFERPYREKYQLEAAHEFRLRGMITLMLCLLLSLGIYQILPQSQVRTWLSLYPWVWVIIFTAWVLSLFKVLARWFEFYVCIGSALAVAITFYIIVVLAYGESRILYHAAMMYAVVIIYGFVGMRFYTACIAGWSGGLIAILATKSMHYHIDWTLLNRTYTFSSLLGMSLAFATDHRHRQNYLQSMLTDIQARQLEALSQQDSLTGLANRRYLDEVLQKEWDRATRHLTPLTILMIDVDYFKDYNDSLGHIEGDHCLKRIADGIDSMAGRSGDLAARYGGEEFVLLFAMTDAQEAIIQAQRLLTTISHLGIPHPKSKISPHVTVSIGVGTIIPEINQKPIDFIKTVDHALYHAKAQGRNRFVQAEEHQITPTTYAAHG